MASAVSAAQALPTQTLPGHVPEAVSQAPAIRRLAGSDTLQLAIGLPLRNQSGLTNMIEQIYDPASTNYHRFLTPEEFATQFGPSQQDYDAVVSFAAAHGFAVTATHSNRLIVDVNASVGAIERAFHVKMGAYKHPHENRDFFAPDTEPTLDQALPILHISGLDNFVVPHPASKKTLLGAASASASPFAGSGPNGLYIGADFRKVYAPGVSLTGAGQTVALVQFDGYYANDIATYRGLAGLPNVPVQNILLNGISTVGSDNQEVALDIEMVMSMAPGANILVYEGLLGNTILSRIANDNSARQISASWSFGVDLTTDQIFQQFAAQGQTYFNASGDSCAYTGSISPPCDSPYITVVGGTTLASSTGATWASESAWNWGNDTGTGGGISTRYRVPSWQQGLSTSANHVSPTMRNIPDVAMIGDGVFVIADNGQQYSMGGTSVASPLWAAFTALINQQATANGKSTVGFLNPALYAIGKGANYTRAFHDVLAGNNTSSISPGLFYATTGYDLTTGWGTPNGANLINLLAPVTNTVSGIPNGFVSPSITLDKSTVSSGNASISLPSVSGVSYTLQYKTALSETAWTSITPVVPGTGAVIVLHDPNVAASPQRFYRVMCN